MKRRTRFIAVPLKPFQIDTAVWFESYALRLQKRSLFGPAGGQPSGVVYNPVTGKITIKRCLTEYFAHQSGVFLPANARGNLPIRTHPPCRDFLHNRKYFINQPVVQDFSHRISNI